MNKAVDITNVILKTKRLTLRPWKESDVDDFYEYAKVDGVGQMAGWLPHESIEISKEILNIFIEGKKTFALEYEGKVIGSLGIESYDEKEFPEFEKSQGREIGYVLSKSYWGMGLMPEAVNKVLEYCFNDIKLDFVICGHFISNNQSARVQEKCGFKVYKQIIYKTRFGKIEQAEMEILSKEDYYKK